MSATGMDFFWSLLQYVTGPFYVANEARHGFRAADLLEKRKGTSIWNWDFLGFCHGTCETWFDGLAGEVNPRERSRVIGL